MNEIKTFPNGLQQLIRNGCPQGCHKHNWPISDAHGIKGNINPPCNSNCPLFNFDKEAMKVTVSCGCVPVEHVVDKLQGVEEQKQSPIIKLK